MDVARAEPDTNGRRAVFVPARGNARQLSGSDQSSCEERANTHGPARLKNAGCRCHCARPDRLSSKPRHPFTQSSLRRRSFPWPRSERAAWRRLRHDARSARTLPAERYHGMAKGLDDFVYLDVSSGVGLGVMSGGRVLLGHSGFAGEIGHITVEPNGRRCGCGNRGCLETVASDAALAWRISRRLGRSVDIDEVIRLAHSGKLDLQKEFNQVVGYLAIALATVINIFNPATLFIHGQLFDADQTLFARVLEQTKKRALGPSFADCQIIRALGSKRQGAVAGIIQHLIDAVVPGLGRARDCPLAAVGSAAVGQFTRLIGLPASIACGVCRPSFRRISLAS